jgi:hypothetical protein
MTTAHTLKEAFIKLQEHARASGALDAPTLATEGALAFPFSVVYPGSGNIWSESAGMEKDLHEIILDLHINKVDLPTDIDAALTFFETFKARIVEDSMLGNTVDTIVYPVDYQFGGMKYAGTETIGYRFRVNVKQKT